MVGLSDVGTSVEITVTAGFLYFTDRPIINDIVKQKKNILIL